MNLGNNTYRILILGTILSIFFGNVNVKAQGQFVSKVQEYQNAVKLKDQSDLGTRIDSSTFNLSDYLILFDKLQIVEKKEPCFMYRDWRESGDPLLYVLEDSVVLKSFIRQRMESLISGRKILRPFDADFKVFFNKQFHYEFAADSVNKLCKNVIPEDNKEGFLQYLFLNRLGENFALKWHSNYSLIYAIASRKELEYYYDEYKDLDSFAFNRENFEKIFKRRTYLKIRKRRNFYHITWVEFVPHHGLFELLFRIDRNFPYRIVTEKKTKLLEMSSTFFY